MSDFLYNLASRALSVEHDIRPRRSSLFEPVGSTSEPGSTTTDGSSELESQDDYMGLREGSGPPALRSSVSQREEEDLSGRSSGPSGPPPLIGLRLPAERAVDHSDAPPEARPHNGRLSSVAEHAQLRPTGGLHAQHAKSDEEYLSSDVVPKLIGKVPRPSLNARERSIEGANARTIELQQNGGDLSGIERDTLLVAARSRRAGTLSDGGDGSVIEKNVVFGVGPSKPPGSQPPFTRRRIGFDDPPIQEKVINVTIGRIEVRASAPAVSKSKVESKTPPVTSLDDYLRQRTGTDRGGGG